MLGNNWPYNNSEEPYGVPMEGTEPLPETPEVGESSPEEPGWWEKLKTKEKGYREWVKKTREEPEETGEDREKLESQAVYYGLDPKRASVMPSHLLKGYISRRREQKVGKMASTAFKKGVTLGGIPAAKKKGWVRETYFGKAKPSLYTPSAPKATPQEMLKPLREATVGKGTMDLGPLREATILKGSKSLVEPHLEKLRGPRQSLTLSDMMKVPTVPKQGWTKAMEAAYLEIQKNHDLDTRANVVKDLTRIGFARAAAERAIDALLELGAVQEVKDPKVSREPFLQVV